MAAMAESPPHRAAVRDQGIMWWGQGSGGPLKVGAFTLEHVEHLSRQRLRQPAEVVKLLEPLLFRRDLEQREDLFHLGQPTAPPTAF